METRGVQGIFLEVYAYTLKEKLPQYNEVYAVIFSKLVLLSSKLRTHHSLQ